MKFGFFSIALQKERELTVKLKNKIEKKKVFPYLCAVRPPHAWKSSSSEKLQNRKWISRHSQLLN